MTELSISNKGRKYEVREIYNSAIYVKESRSHLPGLYYLISWKNYPKEENICELDSIVQYFNKLIKLFYKNYLNKLIMITKTINTISSLAKLITKSVAKLVIKLVKQKSD